MAMSKLRKTVVYSAVGLMGVVGIGEPACYFGFKKMLRETAEMDYTLGENAANTLLELKENKFYKYALYGIWKGAEDFLEEENLGGSQ